MAAGSCSRFRCLSSSPSPSISSLRRHNEIMGNIRLMDADMQLEGFGIMWRGPVTQLGNTLETRRCDGTAHYWRDPSLISSRNCIRITISRLITAPQVVSPGGDNIQNIIPPLCRRVFRRAGHCTACCSSGLGTRGHAFISEPVEFYAYSDNVWK